MGRDLFRLAMALMAWGDRWLSPDGPPMEMLPHGLRRGDAARRGVRALPRRVGPGAQRAGRAGGAGWRPPAGVTLPAAGVIVRHEHHRCVTQRAIYGGRRTARCGPGQHRRRGRQRWTSWQPTACILCECNCGIEVRLGGEDGRRFERIRGDKAHPASQGYTCEKALRLDHYQNGRHRLTSPLRRRPDGTFEEIDWDTAIAEVAARLRRGARRARRRSRSSTTAAAGRGTTSAAPTAARTLRALGARFRSNALAQEKTGEFWVNGKMLGTMRPGRLRARRGRRCSSARTRGSRTASRTPARR